MTQLTLISAQEAYERAKAAQDAAVARMYAEAPHVVEHLNAQIEAAIAGHDMHILLTKEAIESVPNVKPEAFVSFLKAQGYTLLAGKQKNTYMLYFYNPIAEENE